MKGCALVYLIHKARMFFDNSSTQRHILRDWRLGTTVCPACWAIYRDKFREIVHYIAWEKYFVLGRLEKPRQDKILLYWHDEPIKPTKEGPLSYVLLESPYD